jgi:predicted glycogen debranching enzyme
MPTPALVTALHHRSGPAPPAAVNFVRHMPWSPAQCSQPEPLLAREWLVTNALGGYASGTVAGVPTRRYHGLLIAALPAPLGRIVMLGQVSELIRLKTGRVIRFGGEEFAGGRLDLHGAEHLTEFRLEGGLPVWRYGVDGVVFEKRLMLAHRQNTVFLNYRLLEGDGPIRLKLRPAVHYRGNEESVSKPLADAYSLTVINERGELSIPGSQFPPLRFRFFAREGAFTIQGRKIVELLYRIEEARGYEHRGEQWSPGYFRSDLSVDHPVTLAASTEPWDNLKAIPPNDAWGAELERRDMLLIAAPPAAGGGIGAELILAADQFLFTPAGRADDAARARARGDEVRSVIAGYHWFTDWGRDTMISLEGLTLCTGRHHEAGFILRTFAHYVRDGLIPNYFPDGENEGVYHTADATLWYFHALHRYLQYTGDRATLRHILPVLRDILDHHIRGTRFNIGVDPADGLLRQGAPGYQLTWMDAKVGDWVVTPRRGKAVEINALWYNALKLVEGWVREENGDLAAGEYADWAAKCHESFNRRFWYPAGAYLYDVVDTEGGTDDALFRPNQVFAVSLDHPVLAEDKWRPVMEQVKAKLLTPVGLRSLAPGSPDYKAQYYGDLRSRDAAYHQGTVWAWLIGPFVDAWLRVNPGRVAEARGFLAGFDKHLDDACLGSISEVFDAEPPYTPRGCIAQAWSVAEVLRSWAKTTPPTQPLRAAPALRS